MQALQTPLNLNALLDSIPTPPQKGWERVRLKSVIADIDTQSQIPSEKEFFYIGLENIQKGGKKFEIVKATPKEVISNSLILKKGYVYYSKLRPYLKKIFYSDRDEKVYASSELVGLKFSNDMNANLMLHILLSDFITKQEINTKGLRMPRIGIDEIQNFTIFKPPLEAQEKIISAISKVEERINLIDSSLESLEAQKAKILKDILEGNKEREQSELKENLKALESLTALLLLQKAFLQSFITKILEKAGIVPSLNTLLDSIPTPPQKGWERVRLSNTQKFSLSIGKRVLDSELQTQGTIPVYSANVKKPFGYIDKELLEDYESDSVLWGIDGDFMVGFMPKGTAFYPTDHCGILRVTSDDIVPKILSFALENEGKKVGFRREYRASLERVRGLQIPLPPLEMQEKITFAISKIEEKIQILNSSLENLQAHKNKILQNALNLIRDV
ncbi:restriction endonuclease subunit S [Campylobacter avium]|uniref:restriction endonuclease subunit S n=1 Tax=Campylobacter avium TaxID=522485 RepID=UPI0012F791F8|nr:restriction endonuclease subunit S [Campylobacter avium]